VTDKTAARVIRRCNAFMAQYFIGPGRTSKLPRLARALRCGSGWCGHP
jgi:hypothetical protein